jgi:hypothetical protein
MGLPHKAIICSLAAFLCCAGACVDGGDRGNRADRASLIGEYRAAACVAQAATPTVFPRTREWDTKLSFPNGMEVVVRGADAGGAGAVSLYYPQTGDTVEAAYAGDYINATDVRVDLRNGLLYVRAYGARWIGAAETWLFKYDVQHRRLLRQLKVDEADLPAECEPGPR